jgi:MFS family permease
MVVIGKLGKVFARFQGGVASSDLGDGISRVVLPLIAADLTKSPLLIGLVAMATRLPWLLFGLPAGAMTDRMETRRILVVSVVLRSLVIAVLVTALLGHAVSVPVLMVSALAAGGAGVAFDVAAQSVVPVLVEARHLHHANARVYSTQVTMNQLAGPGLGGLLAGWSLPGALTATGLAYATSSALVRGLPRHRAQQSGARGWFETLGVGLAELWRRRELGGLAVVSAVQNCAYSATMAVLVLYVVDPGPMHLNDTGYGLLLTSSAAGALLAGWSASRCVGRFGERATLRTWTPVAGVGLGLIASTTAPWTGVLGLALYGFSTMVWNVVVVSYRQRTVPNERFGRVNAAYRWLSWGAMPIGSLLGGVLGEVAGVRGVLVASGIVAFLAGLAVTVFLGDSLRESHVVSGKRS